MCVCATFTRDQWFSNGWPAVSYTGTFQPLGLGLPLPPQSTGDRPKVALGLLPQILSWIASIVTFRAHLERVILNHLRLRTAKRDEDKILLPRGARVPPPLRRRRVAPFVTESLLTLSFLPDTLCL